MREVVAGDAAAARQLWSRLLDLDLSTQVSTGILALDDPLLSLLVDVRSGRATHKDNLWARIIDLPAALAGRQYQAAVDVVLEVSDQQLAQNAGRWHLTAPAFGPASVRRTDAAADLAVLRFNTRGTASPRGRSEGTFDGGDAERFDVAAAIEFAEFTGLPRPWLVGWSFGTELALMHGADPAVEGAILLSPPLNRATDADLDHWDAFGRPLVALVPELDDFLRPDEARRRFARVHQAEVIGVDGAKHLWVGEASVRRVLDEIVAHVLPGHAPLPTTWSGELGTAGGGDEVR